MRRRMLRGLGYTSATPAADGSVVVTSVKGNQVHTQAACVSTVGSLLDDVDGYYGQVKNWQMVAVGGAVVAGVIGYLIGKS
jgi:hypothetical protein